MTIIDLTNTASRVLDLDVAQAELVTSKYLDEDQPQVPVPLGGGRLLVSRRDLERIKGALPDNYLGIPIAVTSEPSAPAWRDGPPPMTAPGKPVYVWREGCDVPVSVMYFEGSRWRAHGMYWLPLANRETGRYEPWGDARWAPILKPA